VETTAKENRMTGNGELPVWRTPDFVEYDTPMEITGTD
jgi:PqqA family protein